MARVALSEVVLEPQGRLLTHIDGASVTINVRGGSAATLYAAATGSTTVAQPLTTVYGRVGIPGSPDAEVWITAGSYDMAVLTTDGRSWTQRVEAVSGSAEGSSAAEFFVAALGSGVDARAVIEAAVASAVAYITSGGAGARVTLGPGIHHLTSGSASSPTNPSTGLSYGSQIGVGLPVGLAGKLRIVGFGRDVTTVKLSDNARNVFWISQSADYDTFRNVELSDFSVDNNSTVGRCHIIIGNMPAASTPQQRLNFADLAVRRVNVTNVPAEVAGSVYKSHVLFLGAHASALEATQTSSRRIVVEDMRMADGSNGACVASFGAGTLVGGTNHYYDQIVMLRLRHEVTLAPTTSGSQTSFYVCGSGFGDYFKIEDCHSTNIADDAIEVGAMQRGEIVDCSSTDAFLESILFRNSHALSNVTQQRVVVRNFVHRTTSAISSATSVRSRPVMWISDNSNAFGTFNVEDMNVEIDGLTYSNHTLAGVAMLFDTTVVERRTFDRLKVRITNYVYDGTAGTVDVGVITNDATSGAILFRDLDIVATSSAAGGAATTFNFYGVQHRGSNNRLSVDGYDVDMSASRWTNSTNGAASFYIVGKTSGSGIRSHLTKLRPTTANYGVIGAAARPVWISTATTIGSFRFTDSDLSALTNISADVTYSGGVNDSKVIVHNVIARAGNLLGAGGQVATSASAYTALAHDDLVRLGLTSAVQTVTLPPANAVQPGRRFTFVDEGNAGATFNKTIQRAGSDTFLNGTTGTTAVIATNAGKVTVYSDGTSKWVVA